MKLLGSSLSPEYRRRLFQAVAVYAVLFIGVGLWVVFSSDKAADAFKKKVPNAESPVKKVYVTPQIETTDDGSVFSSAGDENDVSSGTKNVAVALIMTDLGLSQASTDRAFNDLPQNVALAFFPRENIRAMIARAAEKSREALLLLPMEPKSYPKDDPGPKSLLTKNSDEQNAKLAENILKQADGVKAVINFMGSNFLADKDKSAVLFSVLSTKKTAFVEDNPTFRSVASSQAELNSLPYLKVDITVDKTASETQVAQGLIALEKIAREKGYAVGIMRPYPVTFNMVKSWSEDLKKRGIHLVPLSEIIKMAGTASSSGTPSHQ